MAPRKLPAENRKGWVKLNRRNRSGMLRQRIHGVCFEIIQASPLGTKETRRTRFLQTRMEVFRKDSSRGNSLETAAVETGSNSGNLTGNLALGNRQNRGYLRGYRSMDTTV
jgi:hypothetical protein